jgi:hypothetical protein
MAHTVAMGHDDLPPRKVVHVFTVEDRLRQLEALRDLCVRIAALLTEHGEVAKAGHFRMRADTAELLLSVGFVRSDLNDVGGQFPPGPWWLNPKATDFDAPREPWQDEMARLHAEASETAQELRATALLGDR